MKKLVLLSIFIKHYSYKWICASARLWLETTRT